MQSLEILDGTRMGIDQLSDSSAGLRVAVERRYIGIAVRAGGIVTESVFRQLGLVNEGAIGIVQGDSCLALLLWRGVAERRNAYSNVGQIRRDPVACAQAG